MGFKTQLVTTPEGFGRSRLVSQLVYVSTRYAVVVFVPAGFVTDFASVPRVGQLFISKLGRHRSAAAVHDFLYSVDPRAKYPGKTRKTDDEIFLEAMEDAQVPRWKRKTMFHFVRWFGASKYQKSN